MDATDSPYDRQRKVVMALQQHILTYCGSGCRAGEIKDLAISLGVAVDKLHVLGMLRG